MKPKLLLVVGVAVGYVLGARAGRERYDALAAKANGLWRNPRVVRARADATQYAKEQAPLIRARAEAVAKDVADKTATAAKDAAGKASTAAGKASTVARDAAGKATTAARKTADRTVAAAAQTASRVGEARHQALANLDDIGDLDDEDDNN
jgi:hypothetical protein